MSEHAAADAASASADAHPTGEATPPPASAENQQPWPGGDEIAARFRRVAEAQGIAKPDPASGDDDIVDDDAASDAGKALAKRRGEFQRRIDDLTAQRAAVERDRDHWRDFAIQRGGQQQPDTPPGPGAPQLPPELARWVGPEPNPGDFPAGDYDPGYSRAVARYEGRLAQAEVLAENGVRQMRLEAERRTAAFAAAAADAAKQHPDLIDAVAALGQRLPNPVADMLAEAGPIVAYAVAKSPEYEREIAQARTPAAVGRAIGRIEARLEAARNAPPPPKPTAAPPPPAQTARGNGAAPRPDPAAMTAAEYYAARMAGRLP